MGPYCSVTQMSSQTNDRLYIITETLNTEMIWSSTVIILTFVGYEFYDGSALMSVVAVLLKGSI